MYARLRTVTSVFVPAILELKKMFTYIFKEKSYSNTDTEFMKSIGMTDEQIESVLSQKAYEESVE